MLRLLLVLLVLGLAVYATVRFAQRGGLGGGTTATPGRRPGPPSRPSRPSAPDDDDDFLRDLDRRRLHPEDPEGRPDA